MWPGKQAAEQGRQAVTRLLVNSLGEGSRTTYESSFKHWRRWRAVRGQPLFLTGGYPREEEEELIKFVAHKALTMHYAYSTIHVMLYALRHVHLLERWPDPLRDKVLLKMAMKGISRLQGAPLRKVPASMDMLRWAIARLNLEVWDDLMVAIALIMMFLFLMRSREALRKGKYPDLKQCVRVHMVVLMQAGVEVTGEAVQDADEVVLMQGYSKTDPNGQGSVVNLHAAKGNPLCLVELLKKAHRMNPGHFRGGNNFLLTMSDGKVLHRDVVSGQLKAAGVALGAPKDALAVISLRSGGASAMWNEGFGAEDIKKRGRWRSEVWRAYVWDGHDRAKDLAGKMLSSSFSLMASLASYRLREAL